jgi:hypothetical protein
MRGVREALLLEKLTRRLARLAAKEKSQARNGKSALAGQRGQMERLLEAVDELRDSAFDPVIAADILRFGLGGAPAKDRFLQRAERELDLDRARAARGPDHPAHGIEAQPASASRQMDKSDVRAALRPREPPGPVCARAKVGPAQPPSTRLRIGAVILRGTRFVEKKISRPGAMRAFW